VKAGATCGVAVVSNDLKGAVLKAYNYTDKRVFVMSAVVGGLASLCTPGLKWRNIKIPAIESVEQIQEGEKSG
jgi:hypothetical protein